MVVRWVDSPFFDFGVKDCHADPSKPVFVAYFGSEQTVTDCTEKVVFVCDVGFRDVPKVYWIFLVFVV